MGVYGAAFSDALLRSATYLYAGLCWTMRRVERGERRRDYRSIAVSLFPRSVQTHHSPGHQRGFPPFCLFLSTLCFIPSSLVSHHLLLTPLLRKRMQRGPCIISIMRKWGGRRGLPSPLQPHVTLFWLGLLIRHHLSFM